MLFSSVNPKYVDEAVTLIKTRQYLQASDLLDRLITSPTDQVRLRSAIGPGVELDSRDDGRLCFSLGRHGIQIVDFHPYDDSSAFRRRLQPQDYLSDVRFNVFAAMKESWAINEGAYANLYNSTSVVFPPYIGRYVMSKDHILLFPVAAKGFLIFQTENGRMKFFVRLVFVKEESQNAKGADNPSLSGIREKQGSTIHIVPDIDVTGMLNPRGYFGNPVYEDGDAARL